MSLHLRPMVEMDHSLQGRRVFLSTSIPDPKRWEGRFDPLSITDAVVAAARAVITAGGGLVTAAHPTIAPLILYVAREFPDIRTTEPQIIVYQSRLFADVLPKATHELAGGGLADLRWTPAVSGELPEPGRWDKSLELMRRSMLEDTNPLAAIFIGGMRGVRDELGMYRSMYGERPIYPVAGPGGEAALLTHEFRGDMDPDLLLSNVYPSLFRQVVADLSRR